MPSPYSIAMAVAAIAAMVGVSMGDSLQDIDHIVLFMQENRAFDHYFGTMAGVRGFADPNVQINPDGRSTFEQEVSPDMSTKATFLKPWYFNHLGGKWYKASQCRGGGSYGYDTMQTVYNGGLNNRWAMNNTAHSWAYFTRYEVPTHFDIAEGWTVMDMSCESILANTMPNRLHWMTQSVNTPGSPTNPDGKDSIVLGNSGTHAWKTIAEYLEEANITWQVFQDIDNFADNALAYFEQFQKAGKKSPLTLKGNSYDQTLSTFYERAAAGTLPQVSWIIGPAELSEHRPYQPNDGGWLQKRVVDAVTKGKRYKNTALFILYDEIGGWGDHVTPILPPNTTSDEWIETKKFGLAPVGPGYRIPAYVISPWTRGGKVFTEHADHSSNGLFLEVWAKAKGINLNLEGITPWRRAHMSNLVNIFDFDNPNYSLPNITAQPTPLTDASKNYQKTPGLLGSQSGPYTGSAKCIANYGSEQPAVPYGDDNMNQDLAQLVEDGFKQVVGGLTEGRFLTIEMNGLALASTSTQIHSTLVSRIHQDPRQRWIVHLEEDGQLLDRPPTAFSLQSANDQHYISKTFPYMTPNRSDAQVFHITFEPGSTSGGYTFALAGNSSSSTSSPATYMSLQNTASRRSASRGIAGVVKWGSDRGKFSLFSVSYRNITA